MKYFLIVFALAISLLSPARADIIAATPTVNTVVDTVGSTYSPTSSISISDCSTILINSYVAASPTSRTASNYTTANVSMGITSGSGYCRGDIINISTGTTSYTQKTVYTPITFSCPSGGTINSSYTLCTVTQVTHDTTVYSCTTGYYLSNSTGKADSSGQYCASADTQCKLKAESNDYILGSGFSVGGSISTICQGGCEYSNGGSSSYFQDFPSFTYNGVTKSCSVGYNSGVYFTATGNACTGSGGNNYSTAQLAYQACIGDTTNLNQSTSSSTDTSSTGSNPSAATTTDTPNTSTMNCPYGSSQGTYNGETITYCLDASTSSATSTASSSTSTDSTSSASSSDSTSGDTSGSGSNASSAGSTGSSGSSSSSSSGSSGSSSNTSSATGTISGGLGTAASGASDFAQYCADNPNALACQQVGDTSGLASGALDTVSDAGGTYSVDTSWSNRGSGAQCPFTAVQLSNGKTIQSFAVMCNHISGIKAMWYVFCQLVATFIVFGFRSQNKEGS